MNQEVKEKWLKALRSGEYRQTDSALKDDKGFCCLGVLCDLHREEFGGEWDNSKPIGDNYYYDSEDVLPVEVWKWAGLKDCNPTIQIGYDEDDIAHWNDSGVTFAALADAIEEQL